MKQYKGFTLEQHKQAAEKINEIGRLLNELGNMVYPAYGVSSRIGKEMGRLNLSPNVMSRLKSRLDTAYGEERHPDRDCPYYDGRGYS